LRSQLMQKAQTSYTDDDILDDDIFKLVS
jgi:hypothetical protein